MTVKQLIHSGYERRANDNYPTIDPRCIYALLEHFQPQGAVVDVCAPSGSGIVETLKKLGYPAVGLADAFADGITWGREWIVTNPPYKRPLVDDILWRQIRRVEAGEVEGFASLHRWQFDFAKERQAMFKDHPLYYGKIQMLFRPIWVERRKGDKQPFHTYCWHIWLNSGRHTNNLPVLMYSEGVWRDER